MATGMSQAASRRHRAVRHGESRLTAMDLPLLTRFTPACGPLWRLFDGSVLEPQVRRQARALCVRCGLRDQCKGIG